MPKTNKERLQDNNLELQNIKTQINHLPEYQDIEPIYAHTNIVNAKLNYSMSSYSPQFFISNNEYLTINASYSGGERYIYKLNTNTNEYIRVGGKKTGFGVIYKIDDNYIYTVYYPYNTDYAYIRLYDIDGITDTPIYEYKSKNTYTAGIGYCYEDGWLLVGRSDLSNWVFHKLPTELSNNWVPESVITIYSKSMIGLGKDNTILKQINTDDKQYLSKPDFNNNTYMRSPDMTGHNIIGVDYTNQLCFCDNKIYSLNNDLSLGNYLSDIDIPNITDVTTIRPITEKYYYVYSKTDKRVVIYEFNTSTYSFTSYIDFGENISSFSTSENIIANKNSSGMFDIYKFNASDVIIGYKVYGNNFYLSNYSSTAHADYVVENYSVYLPNGTQLIGTMPNNGALNYTPSSSAQTIPAGYTSGGTVAAIDYSGQGALSPQDTATAEAQIEDLFGEGE